MFLDEIEITVIGGTGGPGKISFFPMKGGPSGGNGGAGGSVYVVADAQMNSLNRYAGKHEFKAAHGEAGGKNRQEGARAADFELALPPGTTIIDLETGSETEVQGPDDRILVARGGRGGLGNESFKSATFQTPQKSEPPKTGQVRKLRIVMKLIADYGLIGLPNGGKSSLLNELTAANVKTANYPFTTLEPALGVLGKKIIADIPGLIEGASGGKGLGIKFLKHIEKTGLLIHCISIESDNIIRDYETVMNELREYNPKVAEKEQIILLTKIDLASNEEIEKKLKQLKKLNPQTYAVSIHDLDAIERLKKLLS
ncbi:GTPase ObgE [Candidatus Microgenomates bacterium]|nr:GTPase ObgE [Candidatus Microgenomates bacterium]